MNKEFIPYEQALALKELGFDEPCLDRYDPRFGKLSSDMETWTHEHYPETLMIPAPLKQQVFRWFREKYGLRGFIGFRPNVKRFDYHIYDMELSGMEYVTQRTMEAFNKDPIVGTYEEAELGCVIKLIEIVKTKNP